jgi:hypothetical protein
MTKAELSAAGSNVSLLTTVKSELVAYFRHLAERVERHVRAVPEEQLWDKPFPFGNSLGHLVLHLTGNLNHYIGAGIAGSGYVRNRPLEFTDPNRYPREQILQRFREAIDLVVRTIESMDESAMLKPVDFPDRHPIATHCVCLAPEQSHWPDGLVSPGTGTPHGRTASVVGGYHDGWKGGEEKSRKYRSGWRFN